MTQMACPAALRTCRRRLPPDRADVRIFGHAVSEAEHPTEADAADLKREWQLLQRVDPIAREVLTATDPWDAYAAANGASAVLVDELTWMPHGGQVYVAWQELTDLFEVDETPLESAHHALRHAATRWPSKPEQSNSGFLAGWLQETRNTIEQAAGEGKS